MIYLVGAYYSLVVEDVEELCELRRSGPLYDDGVFGGTRTRLVWPDGAGDMLAKFFGITGEKERMHSEFHIVHLQRYTKIIREPKHEK